MQLRFFLLIESKERSHLLSDGKPNYVNFLYVVIEARHPRQIFFNLGQRVECREYPFFVVCVESRREVRLDPFGNVLDVDFPFIQCLECRKGFLNWDAKHEPIPIDEPLCNCVRYPVTAMVKRFLFNKWMKQRCTLSADRLL